MHSNPARGIASGTSAPTCGEERKPPSLSKRERKLLKVVCALSHPKNGLLSSGNYETLWAYKVPPLHSSDTNTFRRICHPVEGFDKLSKKPELVVFCSLLCTLFFSHEVDRMAAEIS